MICKNADDYKMHSQNNKKKTLSRPHFRKCGRDMYLGGTFLDASQTPITTTLWESVVVIGVWHTYHDHTLPECGRDRSFPKTYNDHTLGECGRDRCLGGTF